MNTLTIFLSTFFTHISCAILAGKKFLGSSSELNTFKYLKVFLTACAVTYFSTAIKIHSPMYLNTTYLNTIEISKCLFIVKYNY